MLPQTDHPHPPPSFPRNGLVRELVRGTSPPTIRPPRRTNSWIAFSPMQRLWNQLNVVWDIRAGRVRSATYKYKRRGNLSIATKGPVPETIVFSQWCSCLIAVIFAEQIAALKNRYRCIAYDHRGQGASECTEHGLEHGRLNRRRGTRVD